jgi:hypothetical protein
MTDYTPSERETAKEKLRLIESVKPELKEHGLVDLTDFVNKKSREGFKHPGFVRSLAYRIEEIGLAEVIVRKEWTEFYIKRNIYSKRHPLKFAFILAAVGVIFSIIAGAVNAIVSKQLSKSQAQREIEKLEQLRQNFNDSLSKLEPDLNAVQDTLEKYKRQ